jgi:hypothetical protein
MKKTNKNLIKNSEKLAERSWSCCVSCPLLFQWFLVNLPSQEFGSAVSAGHFDWVFVFVWCSLWYFFFYLLDDSFSHVISLLRLLNNKCKVVDISLQHQNSNLFLWICVTGKESEDSLFRREVPQVLSLSCEEYMFWWRIWSIKDLGSFYLFPSLETWEVDLFSSH